MRIGLIGTGNVARAVAAGAVAAGHDVVLGSRDPKAREGLDHPVVSVAEAAAHGEIVVNATPGTESVDVLKEVGEHLAGKVLLDIAVGYHVSDEGDFSLAHPNSSVGEQIQRALPEVRVVKTLCTMDSTVMADPAEKLADGATGTVFLSGDDPAAKERVGALLTEFGWPAAAQLDLGGIVTARGQEHLSLLFVAVMGATGSHTFNFQFVRAR